MYMNPNTERVSREYQLNSEDKFILEFSNNDKNRKIGKRKSQTIELTIGDIACFVKPHSDFVVILL
jgi:hypothetical protein